MNLFPSHFTFTQRQERLLDLDLASLRYAINWTVRPHSVQWQSRVVESTLMRLPIGTIYTYNWFGNSEWGIVDGMERLIALRLFMTDELVLDLDAMTCESMWESRWSDFSRAYQRRVEDTQITFVEINVSPNAWIGHSNDPINKLMRHIRGENDV